MATRHKTLQLLMPLIVCLCTLHIQAKVTLPGVLANQMVLQQQAEVNLWGCADPTAKVKITTSWDKKAYVTIADDKGYWLQKVNTPVAGGPYEISFYDGDKTILSDILIGEVWFCSGQSNMEMPMQGFDRQPIEGGTNIIAKDRKSVV